MKKLLLTLTFSAGLIVPMLAGTVPLYENFGDNDFGTTPPEIDALAFANYGFFGVTTTLPYDFQNTVNFTNTGTMDGSPGFFFDTASSSSPRRQAGNFVNANSATVSSSDQFFPSIVTGTTGASYLLVNSTNVDNKGLLSTGAGGLLSLSGSKLNLADGGLQVLPIDPTSGSPFITPSNFVPDIAIYDEYWGGVTNQVMDSSQVIQGGVAISPPTPVTNSFGGPFFTQIAAFGFVYTGLNIQTPTPTNILIQAAFVGLPNTNFVPTIEFAPSAEIGNLYKTVVVRIALPSTNVVTDNPLIEEIYLLDRLASSSNYTTLTNLTTFPNNTMRPSNYELTRSAPLEFFTGVPGNSVLTNNVFTSPSYSNTIVTNLYGAYSAFIDKQPIVVPPINGASITNVPGRIEIRADSLDLGNTRMRGNSFIFVDAKHLITSANAVVDSPDLTFTLASTNGNLQLQNLIPDTVVRFQGTMNCWSGFWSNQTGSLTTNIGPDPNDPTMIVTNLVTNIVDIGFHALIVDGSGLSGLVPVTTHVLSLASSNVVISDNPQVIDTFRVQADTLNINGTLTLSSDARDWTATTAPTLKVLTNQGTLSVENNAFFGSDRTNPYASVVNRGILRVGSMAVRSDYFENAGTLNDTRNLQITTANSAFQNGTIVVGGDFFLTSGTAKFDHHNLTASRGLHFTVTDSLADSGPAANNQLNCTNGFELSIKPVSGDLLGTTLRTTAPNFTRVRHVWAARDLGATAAGYNNNAAIGQLALNSSTSGRLAFSGAGVSNGLYVDFLQLSGPVLTNLTGLVSIDPNLVIYFADSNGSPEQMNGLFGGHLVWAKDFAGPNSSVDVLRLNGQTTQMNRALRNSTTIDTDGDGVANAFDVYPLDPEAWNGVSVGTLSGKPAFTFSWFVSSGSTYQVESTTNLAAPNWQPVPSYGGLATSNGVITITDTNLSAGTYRFYRIRYNP
jgi:hypothetical protein